MPMPERPTLPAGSTMQQADALGADALAGRMKPGAPPSLVAPTAIIAKHSPCFFLYHHPGNWDLSSTHGDGNERLKSPTLLPQLQSFPISPGVFGNRTRRDGEPFSAVYSAGVELLARKKKVTFLDPAQVIPAWALPPGVPEGGYLRELQTEDPATGQLGSSWLEVCHTPSPTQPGQEQLFTFRRKEYELWLAWLVQTGVLRPAAPSIAEAMIAHWANRVSGVMTLAVAKEAREVMLARRRPQLEAAQGAKPVQDLPPVAGEVV